MAQPCVHEKDWGTVLTHLESLLKLKNYVLGGVFMGVGQLIAVVWFFAADHFEIRNMVEIIKEMDPKVTKLQYQHDNPKAHP